MYKKFNIKIALTLTLLWSLYDGFVYGNLDIYFVAKLLSLLAIILIIPSIFYLYTLITKKYIVFLLSDIYFSISISILSPLDFIYTYLSIILLFVIFGIYMIGTVLPFKNFIFEDSISNEYSINSHRDL